MLNKKGKQILRATLVQKEASLIVSLKVSDENKAILLLRFCKDLKKL
jgi:hypothetical protein